MTPSWPAALMAVALLACSHEEPFSPEFPGETGPLVPGPPAQLTTADDLETWPSWAPAGGILHTWSTGQPDDGDRCIGLLPTEGGQRTAEHCADYPGHADTTDYLEPAILDADGRLAYYLERSFAGFPGSTVQEIRLGALDQRQEESRIIAQLPMPGPAGRPLVGVSHLRWLGPDLLGMVLVERLVFAVCLTCPLDTLSGGRALGLLQVRDSPTLPEALLGTTDASSLDASADGSELYFTVVGESGVYRLPASGGAPSLVLDATGMGIVRDVAVGQGVLYLVAGGEIDVIDTSNGRMQEDAGGRVFRYDLASGALTPLTPEDGPWYRRLALHPDGTRLLAEREGNLWMLETPGS